MFKEGFRTPATFDLGHSRRFSQKDVFFEGLRHRARELSRVPFQVAKDFFSAETRSAHQNWDTTLYCQMLSSESPYKHSYQYTVEQLLNSLQPNWKTFSDEYLKEIVVAKYRLEPLRNAENQVVGSSGLDHSYNETLASHGSRYEEHLKKLGKGQERAAIETVNSERLDQWVTRAYEDETMPIGSKLAWCSPPYRYFAPEQHSFIWIYEKKLDEHGTYVEMTQYRCWPSLVQMHDIQTRFLALGQALPLEGIDHLDLNHCNTLIATMIELPATTRTSHLEKVIYDQETTWKKQRKDMAEAKLNLEMSGRLQEELQRVFQQFILPTYQELFSVPKTARALQKPYTDPWWSSDEYEDLIGKLDAVFSYASSAVKQWVDNRINGEKDVPITIYTNESKNQYGLYYFYETYLDILRGTVSEGQIAIYNGAASTLLSRAVSVGQCGLGSFLPRSIRQKIFDTPKLEFLRNHQGRYTVEEVRQMSSTQKRLFRKYYLRGLKPFTLTDQLNQDHTFWVNADDHHFYQEDSYIDNHGQLLGPCHTPLTMENDELIYTQQYYQELLAESNKVGQNDQAVLQKLRAQKALALAQANTEAAKQRINDYFDPLIKSLTAKVENGFMAIATLGMSSFGNAQSGV